MRTYILLVLVALSYACNNNLTTIGQDMMDNSSVIELKTIKINDFSTFKLDSFVSSSRLNANKEIFIGRYSDSYSGETEIVPTFQISQGSKASIPRGVSLDSVTFHFAWNDLIWGDTLQDYSRQEFELCRIKETPLLNYDEDSYWLFYSNSEIPEVSEVLSTTSFVPKREYINRAYFKLDNETFGYDMFDKLKTNFYYYGGRGLPWNFVDEFKGLCIRPKKNNNIILGLKSEQGSMYMRFHYRSAGNDLYFDLPLTLSEYTYYNVAHTPIDNFAELDVQSKEVPFERDNLAIIQGQSGYFLKMTLPRPILDERYKTIIKVELSFNPSLSRRSPISYPKTLSMYRIDERNVIKSLMYNNSSSPITGIFNMNEYDLDASTYTFDMTEYYQNLTQIPPTTEENRIDVAIGLPVIGTSFDRVILETVPVLKIYYASYNK